MFDQPLRPPNPKFTCSHCECEELEKNAHKRLDSTGDEILVCDDCEKVLSELDNITDPEERIP
jgi:hypothetical protein